MPKRRYVDRSFPAVLRATDGDLAEKRLRAAGYSPDDVRFFVLKLDELDLTERRGPRRARVLAVSFDEALRCVAGLTIPAPGAKVRKFAHYSAHVANVMRVEYDPGGLFRRGAEFPEEQVLPRSARKDDPDRWYIGTRFTRYVNGKPSGVYEYDGAQVRRVNEKKEG